MSDFTVGIVYTPCEWRPAFQRHVRDHVAGISLRLVRDSRMATEEHLDVLVVDNDTSFLSASFVAALRSRGVRILGVYDPGEADLRGANALQKLGVDRISPSTLAPEDLLAQLQELVPERGLDHRFEEVVAGLDLEDAFARGQVIGVGGPPGAGATEVAVALADAVSADRATVLVDVDEVDPGVARRLQLSLYPHVLSALDELRGAGVGGDADPAQPLSRALARSADGGQHPLGFDVIVGLANRRDWGLLRGDDVACLVDELASHWGCVVANLGPHLEDLSRHVDRFGASRAVVAAAEYLVGVCEASPRGLLRFLDWLADVEELAPGRQVHVALNRAQRSPYRQGQLETQLCDLAGPHLASVTIVPDDAAVGRASWDGVVVARGGFRRAVKQLAANVAPAPPRRRRLKVWG
ncbi:MAG: hypothetical protein ACR2MO_00475 [Acidimicrobiales bacterium]